MARKNADLETVLMAQDFLHEHWNWTNAEKTKLGDVMEMGKIIKARLENAGCEIEELYAIKHDKDNKKMWNNYKMIYELKFTSNHAHFVIKFKKGKGKPLNEIALAIGVEENFIEKPKRGRYSYDNMLSYLTHIKYPKKYQYSPDSVCTIAGKDYMEYFSERREAWMIGRAEKIIKDSHNVINFLKVGILKGEITKEDLITDNEWKLVYGLHKTLLDGMFDRKNAIQDLERHLKEKGTLPP